MGTLKTETLFEIKTQINSLQGLIQMTLDNVDLPADVRENQEAALDLVYSVLELVETSQEKQEAAVQLHRLPIQKLDPEKEFEGKPPLNILVAEDNAINRKVIEKILTKRGHKVEMVENGLSAVNLVSNEQFDVVIMDIQMPILGGVEALQQIRAKEKETQGGYLPVVALSAGNFKELPDKDETYKFDDYLPKPINVPTLLRSLYFCKEERYKPR